MTARIGQKAPEFTTPTYYKGGFTNVSLTEFADKQVIALFLSG
jgi:peroxiredoxin (alkyl hydroperoxide reductase subunit C)